MTGLHARPRRGAQVAAVVAAVASALVLVAAIALVVAFGGWSRSASTSGGADDASDAASQVVFAVDDRAAQTDAESQRDELAAAPISEVAEADADRAIPRMAISALGAEGGAQDDPEFSIARVRTSPAAYAAKDGSVIVGDAAVSADAETADLSAYPAIESAIRAYADAGYDASFVAYDYSTGTAMGWNVDRVYFCASAVKAPFCAYVLGAADAGEIDADEAIYETEVREGTGVMADDGVFEYSLGETIEHTILRSDNTGYRLLWRLHGGDGFDAWAEALGVSADTIQGAEYPSMGARDLARLWVGVERYVSTGAGRGEWLGSLLAGTERSFIRPMAGEGATVLSKPGFETNTWYPNDPFDYGALHDAGIVEDEAGRWLIVVMSNANYDSDCETETEYLIDGLIGAILGSRAAFVAA